MPRRCSLHRGGTIITTTTTTGIIIIGRRSDFIFPLAIELVPGEEPLATARMLNMRAFSLIVYGTRILGEHSSRLVPTKEARSFGLTT